MYGQVDHHTCIEFEAKCKLLSKKYMSSLDNIDARIGRKPNIRQKFHATSKIYGA
jgi:hypothetical protein